MTQVLHQQKIVIISQVISQTKHPNSHCSQLLICEDSVGLFLFYITVNELSLSFGRRDQVDRTN